MSSNKNPNSNQRETNSTEEEITSTSIGDDHLIEIHEAIKDFVLSLWELYGKKNKALATYNRLLTRMIVEDTTSIERNISAFRLFVLRRGKLIKTSVESFSQIPTEERIKYSERIAIDIGHFIKNADDDVRKIMRQHLLTIMALMFPEDSSAVNQLKSSLNIDTSTNEGEFVGNIMNEFAESMSNADNPMSAIMNLTQSGLIPKMFTGLEQGLKSGQINLGGLMTTIQSTMGSLLGPEAASIINPEAFATLVKTTEAAALARDGQ